MHVKSIDAAVYDTVHDYKGGATALGAVVGIGGTVLSSKANPNTTTHHLTLREAVRIMGLTGDHQILRAVCHELGYLDPIRRIEGGALADDALLDLLAGVFSESGDVARVLQQSLADGRITRGEFGLIEEQIIEAQSALATLLDRVRSLVVEDARRPLRQVR